MDLFSDLVLGMRRFFRLLIPAVLAMLYLAWLNGNDWKTPISDPWRLLGLCMVYGIIAYAIYISIISWAMGHIWSKCSWIKDMDLKLEDHDSLAQLLSLRLLRERHSYFGSEQDRLRSIRLRLDAAYPWVVFLYCTTLLLVVAFIYRLQLPTPFPNDFVRWMGAFIPLLSCGASLLLDMNITAHEHRYLSIQRPATPKKASPKNKYGTDEEQK